MGRANKDLVDQLCRQYSNWGKWGPDDELGNLNEVTPRMVAEAAGLIREGRTVSLSISFDDRGPQTGSLGRTNPVHVMLQDGGDIISGAQAHLGMEYTDDAVYMPLQCATQWDSLAHVFHEGRMWNDYPATEVSSSGARRNSIDRVAERFVGRGVLLDLPASLGMAHLPAEHAISSEELDACAREEGVRVGAGDFVLVRTGHLGAMRAQGSWAGYVGGPAPGLSVRSCGFFCERRVAAVALDTWTVEVWPQEVAEYRVPVHLVLLVHAGIHLGEMFDLESLSAECAARSSYEFFFAAPALKITGAVGSPINPLAVL